MWRYPPLHWAASRNASPGVIERLLEAGTQLNARNGYGNTPLHSAATNASNPAVIETLLAAGADVYATTFHGRTAWQRANSTNRVNSTNFDPSIEHRLRAE